MTDYGDERLRLKGRLAEAQERLKNLEIRFDANRRAVRVGLDLYKRPLDVRMLEVADGVQFLLKVWEEIAQVVAEIESLKKDLGD